MTCFNHQSLSYLFFHIKPIKTMETPTKSLEYAYPTSQSANDYGYPKTGCWMVATKTKDHTTVGRKAFDSKEAAQAAFNAMNAEVYQFSH